LVLYNVASHLDSKSKVSSGPVGGTSLSVSQSATAAVGQPGKERRRVIMIASQLDQQATLEVEEVHLTDPVTGLDSKAHSAGAGQTLVVLNGLLGLNKHWFEVMHRVSDSCRCVLIEPPLLELKGEMCSVKGVTRIVIDALERLGAAPAVLAGNSLGGHVAMRIALERPELVKGLVLMGSSGLFERTFERNVMHAPSRAWLDNKIGDLFSDRANVPPGMVDEAYAELSQRKGARAIVKLGKSAKNDHLGEEVPNLRVPTLLLWGRQDTVTPPEVAEEFRSLIPGSRLEWIDRCGHAPQLERPEELASHLGAFMRSEAIAGDGRARA
jgi:pimeloyl-ACP methyl ester carboxylesterase